MPCINNLSEMLPLFDQTFRQTGKHKDNASKAIKINSNSNKVLDRPLITPPLHQDHGIINQSPWILIELEHQEETGGGEEEVHKEEM